MEQQAITRYQQTTQTDPEVTNQVMDLLKHGTTVDVEAFLIDLAEESEDQASVLSSYTPEQYNAAFIFLLAMIRQRSDFSQIAKTLYKEFSDLSNDYIISVLLETSTIYDPLLRQLLALKLYDPVYLASMVIENASDNFQLVIAIRRLQQYFDYPVEDLKTLLDSAYGFEKTAVYDLLQELIIEGNLAAGESVERPEWVIDTPEDLPDVPDIVVTVEVPADEVLSQMLQTPEQTITVEELSKISEEDKERYYRSVVSQWLDLSKGDQLDYFQRFGPVNVRIGETFDEDNICTRYGGCRMLLCTHAVGQDEDFDLVDEIPLDQRTWFTGTCQICSKRIPKQSWALRAAIPSGSWIGCYCSLDCLWNDPDLDVSEKQLTLTYHQMLVGYHVFDLDYLYYNVVAGRS